VGEKVSLNLPETTRHTEPVPPLLGDPEPPEGKPVPVRFVTSNELEVERFRALYLEKFGVVLEPIEAGYVATKYLHMFQILTYEK
jgi:hypothetical protein